MKQNNYFLGQTKELDPGISYPYANYGTGRFWLNAIDESCITDSNNETAVVDVPFGDSFLTVRISKADIFASYTSRALGIRDNKINIGLKRNSFPLKGRVFSTGKVVSLSPEELRKGYNTAIANMTVSA